MSKPFAHQEGSGAAGTPAGMVVESRLAQHLSDLDVLADGAIVWRMSFRLNWVYAHAMKNGKFVIRRYRYDQMVKVQSV